MKSIICVGCGTVGYATSLSLASLGHSITGIDPCIVARNRMIQMGCSCFTPDEVIVEGKLDNLFIDAILITVPTPFCPIKNSLSKEYIMSSVDLISYLLKKRRDDQSIFIILHSTVSVGTSRELFNAIHVCNKDDNDCHYDVFYHPEFIRAEKSENDALYPRKQVFGYVDGNPKKDLSLLKNSLEDLFSPMGSSRSPITMMSSSEEAEYLKLVHNFSNALRISFSNCCAQVASILSMELGTTIDASRVLSVVSETAESFYNNKYGIHPGYPYSGACLPKDVQCFMNITEQDPYRQFIESVHLINEKEKTNQVDND